MTTEQPKPDEQEQPSPLDIKLSLFAGAGIGLLFGMLMGASITPTVATMLGTLTAILTAILGVNDSYFNKTKAARIGAFGFACFIGAYISMYIRANNLMSPSILSLKNEYIAAGFSQEQALAFIAQQRLGATLGNSSIAEPEPKPEITQQQESEAVQEPAPNNNVVQFAADSTANKQHSSLLFGSEVDISSCEELDGTDDTLSLDDILLNLELTDGMWLQLATLVPEKVAFEHQKSVALSTKDAICLNKPVDDDGCQLIGSVDIQDSFADAKNQFMSTERGWQNLALSIEKSDLPEPEQLQALAMMHTMICEGL